MIDIEKRKTPRFDVDLPVAVVRGDADVQGAMLNLSLGGARIHAPLRPSGSIGDRLTLTFEVPTDDEPMTFRVEAEIRWCAPVDPDTLGVQFMQGFRAKETWALGRYIESLEEDASG